MACTTLLVGKKASYDGSTMIARTDDGHFDVKRMTVGKPTKGTYKSVISQLEIELPSEGLSYTFCPSVDPKYGIWAGAGINSLNVSMTATETITSNPRVLGADPYVCFIKKDSDGKQKPGGIGEEDIVRIVLPYIKSAREGVVRLGELLEKYGTYEANGIAFSDENDVWYLETIGGHHWIARRVKDERYVIMPNQFGIDWFSLEDAFGAQKENMCSKDLKEFIEKNHLNLNQGDKFNPRLIFGSSTDADHVYNTPRAWYMAKYFNPTSYKWFGYNADYSPESDDIPWSLVPERKITVEDVKYILSSYYQGTEYNPYLKGDSPLKGKYRPIGISRTGFTSINQIRSYVPKEIAAIEWIAFASNAFNVAIPIYTNTNKIPAYLEKVSLEVSTNNLYWASRLIGALADAHFASSIIIIERYQNSVFNKSHEIINEYDEKFIKTKDMSLIDEANQKIADMAKKLTDKAISDVLLDASNHMKNGYNRADN